MNQPRATVTPIRSPGEHTQSLQAGGESDIQGSLVGRMGLQLSKHPA